jgi:hypothetical protein
MKYKQTIIPSVQSIPKENNISFIKNYYSQNLQGKTVINKHLGIEVRFNATGRGELAYGRAIHKKKTAVLKCLPKLIELAEYNNFGSRKQKDKAHVLGYYNFKAKVKIDGIIENVRITVMVTTDLKAYYNHEVNIIKEKRLPKSRV